MATKIRILLLSGGSLVAGNIVDVLADRRDAVELLATNSVANDVGLFDFDAVFLTPQTVAHPEAFARAVDDILERTAPDLVIPCRDDDVVFLAELGARRPDLADRLLCGNVATALATVDKKISWHFASQHGLPFAPSTTTPLDPERARSFAAEFGYPLLVKPRWGYASRGVRFVMNEHQLLNAASQENLIIQRYLGDAENVRRYLGDMDQTGVPLFHSFEGIKHSIQIIIAPDGSSAGRFFSRNVNRNGTSLRLDRYEGDDAQAIADGCHEAFSNAGWRGPLNIQCQQTPDGSILIYEFNGRLSGATAARHAMGFDELAIVISSFTGRELRPSQPSPSRVDNVLRRAFDIGSRGDLIRQLERDRVWYQHLSATHLPVTLA